MTAIAVPVAAQENTTETNESTQIVAQIDDETAVSDYNWDGERLTIEITAERTKTVQVVEAIPFDSEGSTNIAIEQLRVREGTTEVTVRPEHHPAMIVSTADGIEDGRAAFLNADDRSRIYPDIPFGMSVLFVFGSAGAGALATVQIVKRKRESDEMEVRRLR
ncbi:hypothetical protein [Halalkalirubrum salinum]|uniref:hypothetical protein n=1 Tax=Halalkalirubrum salinum TaxID=2563889 RepID=UPI0010FB498D|nr:hypothetical protein [Halalkalirubrum salinum]